MSAAIFGSVARGREGRHSDVDLLVLSDDRESASERIGRANTETVSKFGIGLSPLVMDEASFGKTKNGSLVRSILKSYIMVRGKDLKEV